MAERRRFNGRERTALYVAADGKCARCGTPLESGWHADHETPYSRGGRTDVINGQALCPECNLKKGNRVTQLREWQQRAVDKFEALQSRDFLISATPGAGKTTCGLEIARRLLQSGDARRVAAIVPTDSLRQQWADEAGKAGIPLMPVGEPDDYEKNGYVGYVATYAQLATGSGSELARRAGRVPTVALMDEVHHAGDNRSWGDALMYALEPAARRIALTGTPWRQDKGSPIPFVRYDKNGTVVVDAAYEYGEAVADGVCRPAEFRAYTGDARWIGGGGERAATLGEELPDDDIPSVLDAVLHPDHEWMPALLAAADSRLGELREEVPDAGGLVIAQERWLARAYGRILLRITGEPPVEVLSDDPEAQTKIEAFRDSQARWLVAVRMVSEGVDIKRLAVGVYAARTRTPLFFRQVTGRFVRTRPEDPEFNACVFIPALPKLMEHAREIEDELRHQLEIEKERDQLEREQSEGGSEGELPLPLSASAATLKEAIYKGGAITAAELEAAEAQCRTAGIPVAYASNVVQLMRTTITPVVPAAQPLPEQPPRHRAEKILRAEVDRLAGKASYRAGMSKHDMNAELLRHGFPSRKKASIEELEQIRDYLAKWPGELS